MGAFGLTGVAPAVVPGAEAGSGTAAAPEDGAFVVGGSGVATLGVGAGVGMVGGGSGDVALEAAGALTVGLVDGVPAVCHTTTATSTTAAETAPYIHCGTTPADLAAGGGTCRAPG